MPSSLVYRLFRDEWKRIAQFLFAGASGLLLNLAITYALTEYCHLWYFWSFLVGTGLSWTLSFFINAYITFSDMPREFSARVRQFCLYMLGYLGFFWINAGIVYSGTSIFGLPYLISITLSAIVTTAGTFVLNRTLIFKARPAPQESEALHGGAIRPWIIHGPALVLALLAGLICVVPQAYFALHNSHYQGIAMMGADAEEHYVARFEEVRDGHPNLGNVFLPAKDEPPFVPALGENIVARLGSAAHLDAAETDVVSKFLFPLLLVLLMYFLGYELSGSVAVGLIAGASLLADALMSGASAWRALFVGASKLTGFLALSRPINPEVSDLFLFGGLTIFYRAFWKGRQPRVGESISIGILAGSAFYVSPFVSTFLVGVVGLAFLWYLFRRAYRFALQAGVALLASGITLLPFVLNYLKLMTSPAYAASALRQGLVLTHMPGISFWLIILVLIVCFAWPSRFTQARPFFGLAIIALIVLTEQQVLTGHALQYSHYHWYITKPIIGLIGALIAVYLAERFIPRRVYRYCMYGAIIAVCLYNAVLIQISSYQAQLPGAIAAQAYAPVLSYLAAQPGEADVWADRTLSLYIPLYTKADTPNNDYVEFYLVPEQFLIERLLLEYKLAGVKPADILTTMERDRADISSRLFGVYYRDQFGGYAAIPDALLDSYAAQYSVVYAAPLAEVFKSLGITTVVWDPQAEPSWKLDGLTGLQLESSAGGLEIYQVL